MLGPKCINSICQRHFYLGETFIMRLILELLMVTSPLDSMLSENAPNGIAHNDPNDCGVTSEMTTTSVYDSHEHCF
jgi:hypothetical protein